MQLRRRRPRGGAAVAATHSQYIRAIELDRSRKRAIRAVNPAIAHYYDPTNDLQLKHRTKLGALLRENNPAQKS